MEAEEIQTQACKFSRIGNTRSDSSKISQQQGGSDQYHDEDEDDGERKAGIGGGSDVHLREWNHSSRIFRVSRASGGKDRHSKVVTAKGLRDRRVRLSVSTAIQFYDLQDRLGVDQPSKAVEWLIKAAAGSIAELPSLESKFPETPKQPTEVELDTTDTSYQQQQHMSLTKSACSSTSETSKGSVSLSRSRSRSEIRVKARERARERTAKDKEKEKEKQKDDSQIGHQQNSQNSSFTELLTGGSNIKTRHHFPSTTSMDYFSSGLFNPASSRTHYSSGFSNQTHFGIPPPPSFNGTSDPHQQHHHHELQQFSFLPDHHLISDATAVTGGDYNLHFTISSSGLAGLNRGTLQSNSPSPLPHHLQRFSSSADGPNMPFFVGNVASASPTENHYFPAGYDSSRHSDLKGKGKS